MKKINLNTASFEKLIANDRLYIDKTEYVWRLLDSGDTEFFLARPRRFGKSLFVSTLKALFQGRRELFRGLAIDTKDYDWQEYPIIHLDFGACNVKTAEKLEAYLNHLLAKEAESLRLMLREEGASVRFENLISDVAALSKTGQVVILVDEYDKPILGNIDNPEVSSILTVLKGFYSVIKTYEDIVRFAFITGVSKFAHVSLFSELNNLTDITLEPDYAEMLGFTEAEIRDYFADRIPLAAKANGVSEEEMMQTLLKWYDGYRFSDADTHVCNPVSLVNFFSKGYKFSNYWDSTGTPEFLVKLSREREYDYETAIE
ncbi:MAG: AAA family ATPase, partial [Victivallales bacterium]|nr:AAA family ATPase [Victivallales bacterium]